MINTWLSAFPSYFCGYHHCRPRVIYGPQQCFLRLLKHYYLQRLEFYSELLSNFQQEHLKVQKTKTQFCKGPVRILYQATLGDYLGHFCSYSQKQGGVLY